MQAGQGQLELGVEADQLELAALELVVGGLDALELGEQGGAALVGDLRGEGGGFGGQGGEVGLVVGLAASEHLELLAGALPAAQRQADLLELGGGDRGGGWRLGQVRRSWRLGQFRGLG